MLKIKTKKKKTTKYWKSKLKNPTDKGKVKKNYWEVKLKRELLSETTKVKLKNKILKIKLKLKKENQITEIQKSETKTVN